MNKALNASYTIDEVLQMDELMVTKIINAVNVWCNYQRAMGKEG